jgi:hypothetical protein
MQVHAQDLQANVARVKLTPPLEWSYALGGYGARMSKPAEGVHDDIWIKVLVLRQGEEQIAVLTMDLLGLPSNVKPQLIEQLADPAWHAGNVMLLPSHSHTSLEMFSLNDKNIFGMPAIGIFQQELLDFVLDRLVEAVHSAEQALYPVRTGTGQQVLEDLNRNRRGEAAVDNTLTVTRIDHFDGRPLACLVQWTAHPTIMSDEDMWVSAGWPGYLQREMEAWIGQEAVVMYYNGAEGDQSVLAAEGGSHYEKAERYGRTIALKGLELYNGVRAGDDAIGYNAYTVELPNVRPHPDFMATGGTEYELDEENIYVLLRQICPPAVTINAVRIGDLLITGAPGELTAELGSLVKENLKVAGARYPVIGGLANEWISYILSEEAYESGGYEASVSFYGDGLGSTIADGMVRAGLPLTEMRVR